MTSKTGMRRSTFFKHDKDISTVLFDALGRVRTAWCLHFPRVLGTFLLDGSWWTLAATSISGMWEGELSSVSPSHKTLEETHV